MSILGWALGVVVVVGFLWWMSRSPRYRSIKLNDLPRFFSSFADTAAVGSLMFIHHEGSDKFIQFAKSREGDGRVNLKFSFPDAPWSRSYFDKVVLGLSQTGMSYHIEETTDEPKVRRFVTVNFIQDAQQVLLVASTALDALDVLDQPFRVVFEGVVDPQLVRRNLHQREVEGVDLTEPRA